MLRSLAQQDEDLFSRIAGMSRTAADIKKKGAVPMEIMAATAGIILDSAPARLNPDIAARYVGALQKMQRCLSPSLCEKHLIVL